ncbi:hypothetical protein XH90_09345 [Bradyrhizobium sp. CCBAU 53338]|nr:hypothetical protein XH90_09345 [Bradyrhizobium sp. CCBAU 53338]
MAPLDYGGDQIGSLKRRHERAATAPPSLSNDGSLAAEEWTLVDIVIGFEQARRADVHCGSGHQ